MKLTTLEKLVLKEFFAAIEEPYFGEPDDLVVSRDRDDTRFVVDFDDNPIPVSSVENLTWGELDLILNNRLIAGVIVFVSNSVIVSIEFHTWDDIAWPDEIVEIECVRFPWVCSKNGKYLPENFDDWLLENHPYFKKELLEPKKRNSNKKKTNYLSRKERKEQLEKSKMR